MTNKELTELIELEKEITFPVCILEEWIIRLKLGLKQCPCSMFGIISSSHLCPSNVVFSCLSCKRSFLWKKITSFNFDKNSKILIEELEKITDKLWKLERKKLMDDFVNE